MKQFQNLSEAFSYHSHCPLCQEPIEADYKEMAFDHTQGRDSIITTFLVGGDEISINYYSNQIVSYKENRPIHTNTSRGSLGNYYVGSTGLKGGGTEMFRVTASCGKCGVYGYVLQMHVKLDEFKLIGIFLNSESLSIEEGDTLHEIKNVYATEKTEYDKFTKVDIDDGTVKMSGYRGRRNSTITFPLMPMDPENPQAILNRIKNLIIFS